MTNAINILCDELMMHARDCRQAADMSTDAVLSKEQITVMASTMEWAAQELKDAADTPWRPIEEAPRDVDEPVLVHHFEWDAPSICNYIETYDEWCIWGDGGIPMPQPTHWMPLPEPPGQTKEAMK